MALPWHNENPLTIDKVKLILAKQFPDLMVQTIQALGEGWDNTTWYVNKQWVFRFPKHVHAAKLIANELTLLPLITHLSLTIPQPQFIGKPSILFAYPFYGHAFLKGMTGDQCLLTHAQQINLAYALAYFLKDLHQIPLTTALTAEVNYDQLQRVDPQSRFIKTQTSLTYLVKHGVLTNLAPWLDFFAEWQFLIAETLWVVGHGDLYARHLVFNQAHGLSSIIDWGNAEIIHPAIDLAIVYQMLSPAIQPLFWQIYGEVSENTQLLAKLRAIYGASGMAWYAHQVQDNNLMQAALAALTCIAQVL